MSRVTLFVAVRKLAFPFDLTITRSSITMARTKNGSPKHAPVQYRQGDVLITLIAKAPAGLKPRTRDNGRAILAYGEVTGHAHAIDDTSDAPAAALYDDPNAGDGSFVMLVETDTGVVHQEHGRIDLPAGAYRVTRQREWTDADEPRQVAD